MIWDKFIALFQWPPTLTEYIILGLMCIAFVYQLYYYIRYIAGANRWLRRKRKGKVKLSNQQPGVSVIICARNELTNLETFLPSVLTQDYPEYEVIVVDDRSQDSTRSYLQRMATLNNKLRYTFVPIGPYSLSTKKLALTLGFKAAKYDYLLLTDADCRPDGPQWIASMMKGFTNGTEVVLGFGAYEKEQSHINRIISYDTFWNGLQYLGQAISGHPYMGVGRNLAYTKQLFFKSHGFVKQLKVNAGDDDLFVNHVATRHNTNVMIEPKSTTWSIPKTSLSDWLDQKRRHIGVSGYYRFSTKLRLLAEPLTRGIFYLTFILSFLLCRQYAWIIAATLLIIRFIWQISIIDVTAKHLNQRKYHINILWFDIILPLINLLMIAITRVSPRKRNIW